MRKFKTYPNLSEWHDWYAWYPVEVHLGDGKYMTVWLEPIQRRIVQGWSSGRYYRNLDGSLFCEPTETPSDT